MIHNRDLILERFYGVATKLAGRRFPRYNEVVHVIEDADIPAEGENYHFVDPSSGRNLFMAWFRVCPGAVYLYREWPGSGYIPGQGVVGPWAVPDGKRYDGKPGPAQSPFGFGLLEYKREIARLERWKDALQRGPQTADLGPQTSEPEGFAVRTDNAEDWREDNGTEEEVRQRFMDSRFASAPKLERDRPVTLLTQFADLQLFFEPTPGGEIEEGVQLINALLAYDPDRPVDFFNKPRLYLARSCENTRFALRTWTGADGQKGACKDPIDCLHYFAASGLDPVTSALLEEEEDEGGRQESYR